MTETKMHSFFETLCIDYMYILFGYSFSIISYS